MKNRNEKVIVAEELFEECNSMWIRVEERIAEIGCLKPFNASLCGSITVEKNKGKWCVMFYGSEAKDRPTHITDTNIEVRTKFLKKLPFLFKMLGKSNEEAIQKMMCDLREASSAFEEAMSQTDA